MRRYGNFYGIHLKILKVTCLLSRKFQIKTTSVAMILEAINAPSALLANK